MDLAGADEIVKGAEGLLERGARIPRVALEKVNVLYAEPCQGLVNAADEVVSREADVIRPRAGCRRESGLCSQYYAMTGNATRCKPAPDDDLGFARRVNVGRVDEVASANREDGESELARRARPIINHAHPAAMYSSRIANAVSSEHCVALPGCPKVIVPRQIVDTLRPESPRYTDGIAGAEGAAILMA